MNYADVTIEMEVVRSVGDYVVGRKGKVIEKDDSTLRVRVAWYGETKTWVSHKVIEPTSIPYEIVQPPAESGPRFTGYKGRRWQVYKVKG